ncbi:MAG TPA: magnesium chelatase [Firmicutes bacterium]|nr:magnesium chelatase [Bacillota bacterium]
MRSYTSLVRHEGNRELFFFAELAVIGLSAGIPIHLHVEGLRGTGKTTILRAVRFILPQLVRIKGCQFNCHPDTPYCPTHSLLTKEQVNALESEQIPVPYLEISHSAKIGTVVGTLDLTRLTNTDRPEATMLPGTLPQAHRGIVLVDEVNRLADTAPELTDILLDAMGTKPGRVQIEENGLPTLALPLQLSVWASSNPDEDPGSLADIRRQLCDRFDFMIQMGRPREVESLLAILSLNPEFGPVAEQRTEADVQLGQILVEKARRVEDIEIPAAILESLAEIYLKHHLESLRSLEAIKTGSVLARAWRGGYEVTWDDVLTVTPAALRHRLNPEQLAAVLQELQRARGIIASPAVAAGSGLTSVSTETQKVAQANGRREQSKQPLRWWSRVVAWCRRLLRRRDRYQGSERGAATKANNNPAAAGRGSPSAQSNPLDMPLVAPPLTARPLWELDMDDAIARGEMTNDPTE